MPGCAGGQGEEDPQRAPHAAVRFLPDNRIHPSSAPLQQITQSILTNLVCGKTRSDKLGKVSELWHLTAVCRLVTLVCCYSRAASVSGRAQTVTDIPAAAPPRLSPPRPALSAAVAQSSINKHYNTLIQPAGSYIA